MARFKWTDSRGKPLAISLADILKTDENEFELFTFLYPWMDESDERAQNSISQEIIISKRIHETDEKKASSAKGKKKKENVSKESWCYCDTRIQHGIALCPQKAYHE